MANEQYMRENWRTARALLFTSGGVLLCMTGYEWFKSYLHPAISLWESHLITIFFSTLIATIAASVLRRRLVRQNHILVEALSAGQRTTAENVRMISELRETMEHVKQLSGMLPICMHCKKIRNDSGYWSSVESYISAHSDAVFSHGLCPECLEKYYPEVIEEEKPSSSASR